MKLLEYQGKELFRKFGIPTPNGVVIDAPLKNGEDASRFSFPVMVKAQVPVGGRGKAGGIKRANTPHELMRLTGDVLGMQVKGYTVKEVLLEPAVKADRELYLGLIVDRDEKAPLLIASPEGGMDIENVPRDRLFMGHIDPLEGLHKDLVSDAVSMLNLGSDDQCKQAEEIIYSLYTLFTETDCEMAEINPLVVDKDSNLVAVDSRVVVDEEALYRHPEMTHTPRQDLTPLEIEAASRNITFVELEGDVAVVANGAGLTMATCDTLVLEGTSIRAFLDMAGTDDEDYVFEGLKIVGKTGPRVLFLSMLGGITKGDTVARALKRALNGPLKDIPMVVRIKGVSLEDPVKILAGTPVIFVDTTDEGASTVKNILEAH